MAWYWLNTFFFSVAPGANHVTRKSSDSAVTIPDVPHFQALIDAADKAVADGSDFDMHEHARSCGIPNRMLLPKGKRDGMEFALMLAITDGSVDLTHGDEGEHGGTHAHCGSHGKDYPDKKPMGYPLDRAIPDKRVFDEIPNFKYTIVKVFHEEEHH